MRIFALMFLCFNVLIFSNCASWFGPPSISSGLTLRQRYEKELNLNPSRQCSYLMLERTWSFVKKNYYKPITNKKIFLNAVSGLEKELGKELEFEVFSKDKQYTSEKFWQILIKEKNAQKKQLSKLCYASVKNIAIGLNDRFTKFLTPDEGRAFAGFLMGISFSGIGVDFHIIKKPKQKVMIGRVYKDSPAQRAGVKAGDRVLFIDKQEIAKLKLEHVHDYKKITSLTRGKAGTNVLLTLTRKGKLKKIKIQRGETKFNSAECKMLEKIVYCRIYNFSQNALKEFEESLKKLPKKRDKKVILDLRNNVGGLIQQPVQILAKGWFKKRFIAATIKLKKQSQELVGDGGDAFFKGYKTAVLINGSTASAAEIVAGALRDHKKAVLIGTRTFGKGTVQQITFIFGAVLAVSAKDYRTPLGDIVEMIGIAPDIEVKPNYASGKDLQLERAIKYLK